MKDKILAVRQCSFAIPNVVRNLAGPLVAYIPLSPRDKSTGSGFGRAQLARWEADRTVRLHRARVRVECNHGGMVHK